MKLERAVMYLGRSSEKMMFRIESRESHNDKKLSKVYENFRNNNHRFIKTEEIQRKFIELAFNQKTQNIAGIQIADLAAYPIGRWILDKTKKNKAYEIIETKFHKKPGIKDYLNYGLKIFP